MSSSPGLFTTRLMAQRVLCYGFPLEGVILSGFTLATPGPFSPSSCDAQLVDHTLGNACWKWETRLSQHWNKFIAVCRNVCFPYRGCCTLLVYPVLNSPVAPRGVPRTNTMVARQHVCESRSNTSSSILILSCLSLRSTWTTLSLFSFF